MIESISWTKLKLLLECPRCFYLYVEHKIERPNGGGFALNTAVDKLLKTEFGLYRNEQRRHPLFREYNKEIPKSIFPYQPNKIKGWRTIKHKLSRLNVTLRGDVDDLWIDKETGELIVVEYKATSSPKISYNNLASFRDELNRNERQVEFYQWLLRANGFKVADTAYFVYCNGKSQEKRFGKRLRFKVTLIKYVVDSTREHWVDKAIVQLERIIVGKQMPNVDEKCRKCEFCNYVALINNRQPSTAAIRGN